jgi:hypothetical protein
MKLYAPMRYKVQLVCAVLLLASVIIGCESKEEEAFRKRIDYSISFLASSHKLPSQQMVYRQVLNDIKSKTLKVGMAPIPSIAVIRHGKGNSELLVYWIEDQPSVSAIVVRRGEKEITIPLPDFDTEWNKESAPEFVYFMSKIAITPDSDVGRLVDSAPDPTAIQVKLVGASFGQSSSVPLILAPDDEAASKKNDRVSSEATSPTTP